MWGSGGTDWLGRMLRAAGSNKGERDAQQEYHQPTYGSELSFKSVLIFVVLMVAIIIAAILIFA